MFFFDIFSTARLASPLAGSMRTPSHASLARSARQPEAFLSWAVLRIRDVYLRSRIPDPDFYTSRITDSGSQIPDPNPSTKERGEKKFVVITVNVATNFTKL
jgi:hypothetical protein